MRSAFAVGARRRGTQVAKIALLVCHYEIVVVIVIIGNAIR